MTKKLRPDEKSFAGIWTALATPFKTDQSIDWSAFEILMRKQVEGGVTGVVLGGTTGESPTLTDDECLEMVKRARLLVGTKIRVMAGSGTNSTLKSIERSCNAVEAGADSLLVVTPPYNKPNRQGLFEHYRQIAEATRVPICLYHVPSRTSLRLTPEQIAEICEIPYIDAVKESSGEITLFSKARMLSKAVFLSGDDSNYLATLAVGGCGVISVLSNVFPREIGLLGREFKAGRFESALRIHDILTPLIDMLFCETNPAPVKFMLSKLNLCSNILRLPMAPVTDASAKAIERVLNDTVAQLRESF